MKQYNIDSNNSVRILYHGLNFKAINFKKLMPYRFLKQRVKHVDYYLTQSILKVARSNSTISERCKAK